VTIDGNDVEVVLAETAKAIEKARAGGGPTLVEAMTMRMLGHAIHDGAEYVPRELLAEWEAKDPVARYRALLIDEGIATGADLDNIDRNARVRINQAVAEAEAAPLPDPATLTDGVYA
jgi:pyruvate dehydrogenase E1 component alpha subunit